jgi:YidC/Oxa1 family membrane protein insertase
MFNAILVQPLFNLLAAIYALVGDFGLAIIILTVIIRGALWPLVTRQLHSQRAIQDLQPELKRIKSKAAGDRQLEAQMTMELYKEKEISPFASILPLLIQLPVFIALFIVLKDITTAGKIAALAYEPVKHLPAIAEIIKHSGAFHPTIFNLILLTKPSVVLAALAGLAQFIQTKQLMPKKQTGGDAQAQMMASMTYVFPALTFFIGLSLPAALPLYWLTASLMAILQQYLVLKRDVEEVEEAADSVPAPRQADQPRLSKRAKARAKAKGGTP